MEQTHCVGRHIFSYTYNIWHVWTLDDKYEHSTPVIVQNSSCNWAHIYTMYKSLNNSLISFTCTNFPLLLNGTESYLLLIYQHSGFYITFVQYFRLPFQWFRIPKRISNNFWASKRTVLPIYYPTMYSGISNLSVPLANKFTKFHSEMLKGKHQLWKPEPSISGAYIASYV
jgi:hypothetical protein